MFNAQVQAASWRAIVTLMIVAVATAGETAV